MRELRWNLSVLADGQCIGCQGHWAAMGILHLYVCGKEKPLDGVAKLPDTQTSQQTNILGKVSNMQE